MSRHPDRIYIVLIDNTFYLTKKLHFHSISRFVENRVVGADNSKSTISSLEMSFRGSNKPSKLNYSPKR